MELTEDEIIQKYAKNVLIAIETLFFHTNMNGLVSHADSMLSNAKTNLVKYKGRK